MRGLVGLGGWLDGWMVDWLVGQGGGERERGGIGGIGVGVREVEGWLVRWMGTEREMGSVGVREKET